MKTNKLLFTIIFACISFMGISKNTNSPIKTEVEDDMFACNPPRISGLSGSNKMCLSNQNTFTFSWSPDTSNKFWFYQWLILDKQGNIIDQGKITQASQSYKVFTVNEIRAVKFKVRVVYNCGYSPKLGIITEPGPWSVRNFKVFRSAAPVTSVTSLGPFCSGNTVTFTPAPNTSVNHKYFWVINFGVGVPQTGFSDNIPPNADPSFSIPIPAQYAGGPIKVSVAPYSVHCGLGSTHIQTFVPNTLPPNPIIQSISISKPTKYCSGRNLFEAVPTNPNIPIPSGIDYRWTFKYVNYKNQSPTPIREIGFDMTDFNPDFGTGSYGVGGTVKIYSVELEVRSGCGPWSSKIITPWVNVSYSNCNVIYNIGSLTKNPKSKTNLFDMDIYPNPSTSGIFNMHVSGLAGDKTIQVYDVHGKFIIDKPLGINQSKLDLSNYSRGLYFVKISNGVDQKTQKVVF